ncbi:MAG TPA: pitrilysin family protein [Desulfatiglandales bacterium]|nr:pitrilysin family protein [Desulfatiglandales bacterium]
MIYRKTVFDNGTRIITESLSHAKSISLGIWVNAGSRDEVHQKSGIFHLIEHMIFKGTKDRSAAQIAMDFDRIGGFSNAFTSKEQTCFYARVLNKHLKFVAGLFSDIFINSLFAEEDLELEKSVVLQEISMTEDTPDEYVQVLFDQSFWADDSLGRSILGTKEIVAGTTRKEILDYAECFYAPGRVVIAASGSVDHDLLVEYFRPFFESLPARNDGPPVRSTPLITPNVSCYNKKLEQVHLCLGVRASSLSGEERFAETIFNAILGGNMSSRLFQEIREKRGLAYSLYSYISSFMDTGVIKIYIATDKEKINSVLELVGMLVKKLQSSDLSESDLTGAKEYLIGGILLGTENMGNLMTRLAKNEFIFGKHISYEDIIVRLEKVTLDEVIDVSRRMFSSDNVSVTVLGPVDKDKIDVDPIRF